MFAAGRVYVREEYALRELDPQTDWLTTPAGTGRRGPVGNGGLAVHAGVGMPWASADPFGNLLVADAINNQIRIVPHTSGTFYGRPMTAGHIYRLAGSGRQGFSGDGGPVAKADLAGPGSVAVDRAGNLVVADSGNDRIRVVATTSGTFYGHAMTAGDIYTVAGGGTGLGDGGPATQAKLSWPRVAAIDSAGNLVLADTAGNRIRVVADTSGTFYGKSMIAGDIYTVAGDGRQGFSGDGGPADRAELADPEAVAVDGAGNLVVADSFNCRIRVVAGSTGTFYGQAMTTGHIYTVAGNGTPGFSGDGGPAAAAELNTPRGVAVDSAGDLVIADSGSGRVRVVAASTGSMYGRAMTAGDIYAVASNGQNFFSGDGGAATHAQLSEPQGVTVDRAGNLVIADTGNFRIRVAAGRTGTFYGQAMSAGHIYTVAGGGTGGLGDGGPAVQSFLEGPVAVAVDGAGNLVVADTGHNRIRVVAGSTGTFYGQAMTVGYIYTIAGNGSYGFSGDGGPATAAELANPDAVAVDHDGNVVIADSGNSRVRVIAAKSGSFYGQSMTAGHIYTIAGDGTRGSSGNGGPATQAEFYTPAGVAVDGAGNVLISDANEVRAVAIRSGTFYGQAMTAHYIYDIAGTGQNGFAGDGGPATQAELDVPGNIAVDRAGNVVIADTYNGRVRVLAASNGTFYGQAMTALDIYTVAGNGSYGMSGDGGRATSGELADPNAVSADAAGNLLVADTFNDRIRQVAG